jgi:protein-tyrosine phosphatase
MRADDDVRFLAQAREPFDVPDRRPCDELRDVLRPGPAAGGRESEARDEAIVDDDRRSSGHRQGLVLEPRLQLMGVAPRALDGGFDLRLGHPVLCPQVDRAVRGHRAEPQPAGVHALDVDRRQRSAERAGDLEGDGDPAAGDADHHRPLEVELRKRSGKLASGGRTVVEQRLNPRDDPHRPHIPLRPDGKRRYRRGMPGLFVDVHSHAIPSGDDGARSVDEGLALCRQAAAEGTHVLYGTPHAHPPDGPYPITPGRYELARSSYDAMKERCAEFGLELRLGWELSPRGILIGEPQDYVLEGTNAVLLELAGQWFSYSDVVAATQEQVAELRAAGLDVVLAHAERCLQIQADPDLASSLAAEGALLCFNAASFVGAHDAACERCAWRLLDLGLGDLVASDAHGLYRPSRLREAVEAIEARYGRERALALADGSALGRLSRAAAVRAS